jgi:ABC-2 type transport system ATP-binding protein
MVKVEGLRKIYRIGFWRKPLEAIRDVSFQVRDGDLFGFIGPNGAGKSTVIKILLGLLKADAGKAMLMGRAAGTPRSREQVGFLPEQPYFYDYLTGREFLRFYARLSRLHGQDLRQRVEETAGLTGIRPDWLDRKLRTYSKGMLQRIGLAQALLGRPKLVILDEPMSGLDPLGRRDVRNILKQLHAQGTTVFYSSHVLSDVEAICTRLAMIVNGEIRKQGTVSEVLAGEEQNYQIHLSREVLPGELPADLGSAEGRLISCKTPAAKAALLKWALEKGLEVEKVGLARHSLEDVLAQEVGRKV